MIAKGGSDAGWRRVAIAIAVVALIAARKYDSLVRPQFWAEDGVIFFSDASAHPWASIFRPYFHYLHLLPRLIAAFCHGLPLTIIPDAYAWTALAVAGVVAWAIQSPRVPLPGAWAGALAIAAIPNTGEVYLNICNLQWITALALCALVIADDASTAPQRAGDILLMVITGLTGPFIVLLLPLFAWRAMRRRSRWSATLLALAVVCAAVQTCFLLHYQPPAETRSWAPLGCAEVIGRRLVDAVFADSADFGAPVCTTLALVSPLVLAWALWRRRHALSGGGILLAAALIILAANAYKSRMDTWAPDDFYSADRYFFTDKVLVVWLAAAIGLSGGKRERLIFATAAAAVFAAGTPRFIYPPSPNLHWRQHAARLSRGEIVRAPILPSGWYILYHSNRQSTEDSTP